MPGSSSTVALGYQSTVYINGIEFGVKSGEIVLTAQDQECGDTESGVNEVHKGGRQKMEINFDAYEKADVALHDPMNLNIVQGQYVEIEVWDKGELAGYDPYYSEFMLVKEVRITHDVEGKVQARMSTVSSGDFDIPTSLGHTEDV